VDHSEGLRVNKPTWDANTPAYTYTGYILGYDNGQAPYQSLDQIKTPSSTTLKDFKTGPLFMNFLADVFPQHPNGELSCLQNDTSWTDVYTKPDIALNHPARWNWNINTQTMSFNSPPANGDPLDQPFFRMKGLLVTKTGQSPAVPLEQATAGDALTLSARVYNYSVTPIYPPTSKYASAASVHVQFYAQKYCQGNGGTDCIDSSNNTTCSTTGLCGPASLIDEVSWNKGISGFHHLPDASPDSQDPFTSTTPNWVTVSTDKFQSSQFSDMHVVFWVVAWAEDANGNLLGEMPDHGLIQKPGALMNVAQAPVEPHSNNVGLADWGGFFIAPVKDPTLSAPLKAGPLASVALQRPQTVVLNQRIPIRSVLSAGAQDVGIVNVKYYDGNPNRGGKLIDIQRVSHINASDTHTHRSEFVPASCGLHRLFVVADTRGQASVVDSLPVKVTIDSEDALDALITSTASIGIPATQQKELLALLRRAQNAFDWDNDKLAHHYLQLFVWRLRECPKASVSDEKRALLYNQADLILKCTRDDEGGWHKPGWKKGGKQWDARSVALPQGADNVEPSNHRVSR
jgi:hypothetical protein